jgi:hypothetical protein
MTILDDQLGSIGDAQSHQPTSAQVITAEFRGDLAFPKLSEEMVQRLHQYGREESVPANVTLYTRERSENPPQGIFANQLLSSFLVFGGYRFPAEVAAKCSDILDLNEARVSEVNSIGKRSARDSHLSEEGVLQKRIRQRGKGCCVALRRPASDGITGPLGPG